MPPVMASVAIIEYQNLTRNQKESFYPRNLRRIVNIENYLWKVFRSIHRIPSALRAMRTREARVKSASKDAEWPEKKKKEKKKRG